MDFGLVGRLDDALRDAMLRMAIFLVRRDTERLVDEMVSLGIAHGRINRQALKRDLDHFIGNYYDRPIKELAAGKVLDDVMQVALRHRLQFPSDLMLLFKVIAMSEGLGIQLDPEFKLLEFAEPFFRKFWLASRSPRALAGKLAQSALDIVDLAPDLPHRVARLLGELERGEIEITVKHEGLDDALKELERVANRVTMGVITAALTRGHLGDCGFIVCDDVLPSARLGSIRRDCFHIDVLHRAFVRSALAVDRLADGEKIGEDIDENGLGCDRRGRGTRGCDGGNATRRGGRGRAGARPGAFPAR